MGDVVFPPVWKRMEMGLGTQGAQLASDCCRVGAGAFEMVLSSPLCH